MSGSLIELSTHHETQIEEFLSDFDANPSELGGYFCPRDWSIKKITETLAGWSRGEGVQAGWVPCTTRFWFDNDTIQGVINIRHTLTPKLKEVGGHVGYSVAPSHRRKGVATSMLAATLPLCRRLGIPQILLTCSADNMASAKTIERCGGLLDKEGWSESERRTQRWYWINLS